MGHDFKREDRYIVIKKSDLGPFQTQELYSFMKSHHIDTRACVVVESDWPEHNAVWKMIEDRCKSIEP